MFIINKIILQRKLQTVNTCSLKGNSLPLHSEFIHKKITAMVVERIENNRIILNVNGVDFLGIQRLIDYAKYLDVTTRSKAQSSQVAQLADEVSRNWWSIIKNRLLQ
jgi:hypothetical protein